MSLFIMHYDVNARVVYLSPCVRRRTRLYTSLEALVNKREGSDPSAAPTR